MMKRLLAVIASSYPFSVKRISLTIITGLLISLLASASAVAQQLSLADRLAEVIGNENAHVIVIDNGSVEEGGATALIRNRVGTGRSVAGVGGLAAGGGLGYTCTGEGSGGTCTCGPTDPCSGMIKACGKLGGTTTTCNNQTLTCTCKY